MINLIASFFVLFSSLYDLSFQDINGQSKSFGSYQGKKILIVNIASGSRYVKQLAKLEELKDRFGNSLVVIVFPSNSFGNETLTNPEIKSFCQAKGLTDVIIAEKITVKESGIHPVYNWLTKSSENGAMEGGISSDFQKYLIDETGQLVGAFAGGISPDDNSLIEAIQGTYN